MVHDKPMKRFGKVLREARKRAGFTQQELAAKAGVDDTYISKMEGDVCSPPSREVAVKLADANGMNNKPVTLYVSTKDMDAIDRFVFLIEANVAGSEDVKEIRLAEEGDQVSGASIPSIPHPALAIQERLVGVRAEEVERLIASGRYSEEEEEEVWAAVIEIIKRFNSFKETQRKTRNED